MDNNMPDDPVNPLALLLSGLAAAANAVMVTDRRGTILWVNPAFSRLTGYSPQEAVGSKPGLLLKSGVHDATFYFQLWDTILSGQVWKGEITNRRKDGSLYEEEMTVTPFRAGGDQVTHFIAIKQDISDRRQAQEAIRRQADKLERLIWFSGSLRNASSRAETVAMILVQLMQLFQADSALLVTRDPLNGATHIEAARGGWAAAEGHYFPAGQGVCDQAMVDGRPYVSDNIQTDAHVDLRRLVDLPYSAIGVPLLDETGAAGMLWVGRKSARGATRLFFHSVDVQLLTAVADIALSAIQRAAFHEQVEKRAAQLASLHAIDLAINASMDLNLSLGVLLDQTLAQPGVSAAEILLLDQDLQMLEHIAGRGFRHVDRVPHWLPLDSSVAGQAVFKRVAIFQTERLPPDGGGDLPFRDPSLLPEMEDGEGFTGQTAAPMIAKGQVRGVLKTYHRNGFQPDTEWLSFLEALAAQGAVAIDNASLFEHLQRTNTELIQTYDAILQSWVRSLHLRDDETEHHTLRVTEHTIRLARAIGIDEASLVNIQRGALLHDLGKIGVPDAILHKAGPLTDEEWQIMRRHPVYAYELLASVPYLRDALDIPYCHHEKWDGSGYPRGLRGEEIPLAARLFAVVDVWDALRSDRPYRLALPEDEVIAYLRQQAGVHFDPYLVEVFISSCLYPSSLRRPRLLAVDDHTEILRMMVAGLNDEYDVLTASTTAAAQQVIRTTPDLAVVLVDAGVSGYTGLELLEDLRSSFPNLPCVLMSSTSEPGLLMAALNQSNIRGFMLKPFTLEDARRRLKAAIDSAAARVEAANQVTRSAELSPAALFSARVMTAEMSLQNSA